jgi:hypothetical protein
LAVEKAEVREGAPLAIFLLAATSQPLRTKHPPNQAAQKSFAMETQSDGRDSSDTDKGHGKPAS